jgi:hypothetical protein
VQLLPVAPARHDIVAMTADLVALHKLYLLQLREGRLDGGRWVIQVAPYDVRVCHPAPVVVGVQHQAHQDESHITG